jgi:thymidylate synthase
MQRIIVFQQNESGRSKIEGINKFKDKKFIITTFDIDEALPLVLDDTSPYLPEKIDADIVLDFLKHRDLSDDLSLLCEKLNIPVIASGKKITTGKAICSPT